MSVQRGLHDDKKLHHGAPSVFGGGESRVRPGPSHAVAFHAPRQEQELHGTTQRPVYTTTRRQLNRGMQRHRATWGAMIFPRKGVLFRDAEGQYLGRAVEWLKKSS